MLLLLPPALRNWTEILFYFFFTYELHIFQAFTWKSLSKVLFTILFSAVIHSHFHFAAPNSFGDQYIFCNVASLSAFKNHQAKVTDLSQTSRSRKLSAKGSAWKNQLQKPFDCSSTICKQCQHLGRSGSPVTQESTEVSLRAGWGFSKEEYILQRAWMGPCSGSDTCFRCL